MYLCGVDEAGRGALAGPVVAAAVVMKDNSFVSGATDSKLLRENYRDELYVEILNSAKEVTTGIVWNDCIDIKNILKATMTAMKFSLEKLSILPDKVFVDGNYFRFEDNSQSKYNYVTVIKGDQLVHCISCASIIAKVTRDKIMYGLHKEFPEYGFDKHKGYATKFHRDSIKRYGLCKYHRKSFCKKIQQNCFEFGS
ncbi:MAG: ribonuclease HII [Ignavibacteria bacterium]|nr:MAG: ribonuclease HII [Chlorobiota bacterium]MBV6398876.1 Ribonuclease HII [Ignavibacteria bacterium]MCC6886287.1 ribonuclease HII [Ignavibacteriales bacterium]MCE7952260.1 ribonuclease HII [Chlorobi bacterium CHB7]RIK48521.1 MAG: ribonuclease HII [Ignavibacteriota bacterium]